MATIQARVSRGHKYWYIVESRRVNGKPRPVMLEYLGTPENLLQRLRCVDGQKSQIKTYAHGLVAALYDKSTLLSIACVIDRYAKSPREYTSKKPIRNGLTVGQTIVLAAIGRVCRPCSKQSWANWASSTSLHYLFKQNLKNLDSQHFWDHMDCVPIECIEEIESEILKKVFAHYELKPDLLLFDTSNFFTYIATSNHRCTIAKRGKNKQKRIDLRQVGLAMGGH